MRREKSLKTMAGYQQKKLDTPNGKFKGCRQNLPAFGSWRAVISEPVQAVTKAFQTACAF